MLRKAVAAAQPLLPARMMGCINSCPLRSASTNANEKRRKKAPMQPILSSRSASQEQVIRQVPATSTKLRLRVYAPTLGNPWAYALSPQRVEENTWYFDDDASSSIVGASEIRQSKKSDKASAGGGSGTASAGGASAADADGTTSEAASRDSSLRYESMPLELLSAKASAGDALAQRTLGIHYLSHETLLAEGQDALQARERRAAAGAPTDADTRGLTVLSGLHTDACEALGAEWLEKSASQGDPESHIYLAARAEEQLSSAFEHAYHSACAVRTPAPASPVAARTWAPDRAGVLGALDYASRLAASSGQFLAAKLRGAQPPRPPVASGDPLHVGVWYYERALSLSHAPECLAQLALWVLALDRLCDAATDPDVAGGAPAAVASAAGQAAGARARTNAEDDEEEDEGEAAVAAMSALLRQQFCTFDGVDASAPDAGVPGAVNSPSDAVAAAARIPADTQRSVFLLYLVHVAQQQVGSPNAELVGDACLLLADLTRGADAAEAARWEAVGRKNKGKTLLERSRERGVYTLPGGGDGGDAASAAMLEHDLDYGHGYDDDAGLKG